MKVKNLREPTTAEFVEMLERCADVAKLRAMDVGTDDNHIRWPNQTVERLMAFVMYPSSRIYSQGYAVYIDGKAFMHANSRECAGAIACMLVRLRWRWAEQDND